MAKQKMDFTSLTGADVARALGVTRQAVSQWARDGCPRNGDGTYSLPSVFAWIELNATGTRKSPALEEYRQARAEREKLALARDRGEFVPMSEVGAFWADRLTFAKQQIMGMGHSLAPSLVGRDAVEICQRIDDHGRWVCTQLFKEWVRADGYTEAEIEKMVSDHY